MVAMSRCPVCKIQADLIKYEGVPVYNCGSCGGYWMTQARLDLILATSLVRRKLGDS
jgi:Zn-finger nucleic acid-binding protein